MAVNPSKRPSTDTKELSPPPVKRKLAATTTNQAVANFFKPASEKQPDKTTFHVVQETVLVGRHDCAHTILRTKPVKVAAFDFDDTLIATKSGLKFARGEDDWKWWHASVPSRLKKLYEEGYAIVVISNQGAVSLRADAKTPAAGQMRSLNNIKGKIKAVSLALDVPLSVYAATGRDEFRKPRGGLWGLLKKDYGVVGDGELDVEGSFFVGDAGGREEDKSAGRKKDHSCSDRDFAANVGIAFHTPEEFFLDEAPRPFLRTFEPAKYLDSVLSAQTETSPLLFVKKNEVELVLFCGSPGAGKSTFYWRRLEPLGYERVNQDQLKSRDRCMKVAREFLAYGKAVAVDNTNADIETRAAWIALARAAKVPIRLVLFTASAKLCEHNDVVRALGGDAVNPEKRQMLPKMAFTGFASRYREPKVEEGFQDITKVDFEFEGTEEEKNQWKKYWTS